MVSKKSLSVYVVIALLCVPLIIDFVRDGQVERLKGAIEKVEMPTLSYESLNSGHYTDSLNDYLKCNFALKGVAIKTRNQLDYSLFGLTHARSVEMGKDGYLFEQNYIKAAKGLDSLTAEYVDEKVQFFESVSETASTEFFVTLVPGKASYYPQYIPEGYEQSDSTMLNRSYKVWREKVEESEVLNLVDLWGEFIDVEGVFPKNGIHWCEWVQVEALNILNDSIAAITGTQPAKLIIDSTYFSTKMEGTDQDIESGLNLWQDIADLETKYYKSHWEDAEGFDKPKVLIVGDSYAWGVVNRGVLRHSYDLGEFWYYDNVVHGPAFLDTENFGKKPEEIYDLSTFTGFNSTISDFDAVVLLSTDANLYRFPFGFGETITQPEE